MGPLSAVAGIGWLIFFGGIQIGWWATDKPAVLGWVSIIAAALIALDLFWHHGREWFGRKRSESGQVVTVLVVILIVIVICILLGVVVR